MVYARQIFEDELQACHAEVMMQVFRFWLQALMKILATLPDVVLWKVKQLIRLGYQMYDLTTRAR